jgi:hypothetical protein
MRRGAARATGVETDPGRFAIAKRISELHGNYDVHHASAETFDTSDRYDVVLFLNVLHHVLDPIVALRQVAARCSELLVLEFTLADDWQYIENVISGSAQVSRGDKVRARVRSRAIRLAAGSMPIMALGDREYHRVWYFSESALRNLLVVHLKVARDVEFVSSPHPGRRSVAMCWMNG